jgi:hypothetical protein
MDPLATVIALPAVRHTRAGALEIANHRRSTVAALKRRLRHRELHLIDVLAAPPPELDHYLTWEVLLWAPGLGRARLRALNAHALRHGYVNLAAPLGALTPRQRQWLADQLPGL